MFLAKVYVTLKSTVNDPQGLTVMGALKQLGFDTASNVRIGKYLEVWLDETNQKDAEKRVDEMCQQLFTNPVIEEYHYDIERDTTSE